MYLSVTLDPRDSQCIDALSLGSWLAKPWARPLTHEPWLEGGSAAFSAPKRTMHCCPNQKKNYNKNSHLIIHFLTSSGVSEQASEASRAEQANKWAVRAKKANGWASDPVLTSGFLVILDHSAFLELAEAPTHFGPEQVRIQTWVLGHLLVHSLVCSHRSVIRMHRADSFAHSLIHSITPELVGQWLIRCWDIRLCWTIVNFLSQEKHQRVISQNETPDSIYKEPAFTDTPFLSNF